MKEKINQYGAGTVYVTAMTMLTLILFLIQIIVTGKP